MTDLGLTIAPKSNQLNADDLIAGPRTIKITAVSLTTEPEQPVKINYENDQGKPYLPGKSMRRVLVEIWGRDGNAYVGRSMTLYRDASVRFGGLEVGGIRISHMSDLAKPKTLALTATRANKKPFTVKPLVVQAPAPVVQMPADDWGDEQEAPASLLPQAEAAAAKGMDAYKAFWKSLGVDQRNSLLNEHERLKGVASAADVAAADPETGETGEMAMNVEHEEAA